MNHLLITGSQGQLGLEIARLERDFPNYIFFFTDKTNLDITNFESVENFIVKNKITAIINCVAYTNVDKAEDEPNLANEINHLAVKNLAETAKKNSLKLIHISTDYVFDGKSKIPYLENSATNPQSVYGITKQKGEKAMQAINPNNSILIRTSWLYSKFAKNFVKTIVKLSKEKNKISVVNDQIGTPTNAHDLAKTILQIIPFLKNEGVQLYHYANTGECSWFQFAKEIVKLSKNDCIVEPISSLKLEAKATRPMYSLLNSMKIQKTFNLIIPHWKEALKRCVKELNY
jgi:dTDP-4-dehydrorhamnose reductase